MQITDEKEFFEKLSRLLIHVGSEMAGLLVIPRNESLIKVCNSDDVRKMLQKQKEWAESGIATVNRENCNQVGEDCGECCEKNLKYFHNFFCQRTILFSVKRRCPMLNTTIINMELERASEEIFRQRKILHVLLKSCFPKSYLSESEQKKCYENLKADFYGEENLFTLHEKLLLNDELVEVVNKIAATDSDSYRKILDSDIGSILKRKVFEFSDIVLLDDRSFQKVLRYVSMETIAVAFIGENDALEAKLFKNLSKRAASDFKNLMCKKRDGEEQSDVLKKQGLILKAVHRLIKKGEILFPGELIYD